MADKTKTTFPMLPVNNWRDLRKKFQQSMPDKISVEYLASILGMGKGSAQNNVLPYLKTMGIIDEEGKTTPLANKWRFDETYAEVCKEIRTKIYPQELLDAFPNPAENRSGVEKWFAMKIGAGEVAARRMATLYTLLCEADPTKGEKAPASAAREKKSKPAKERQMGAQKGAQKEELQKQIPPSQPDYRIEGIPSIHIDLQIHLSPEATADQIDQIFASMAKHLKDLSQPHK